MKVEKHQEGKKSVVIHCEVSLQVLYSINTDIVKTLLNHVYKFFTLFPLTANSSFRILFKLICLYPRAKKTSILGEEYLNTAFKQLALLYSI